MHDQEAGLDASLYLDLISNDESRNTVEVLCINVSSIRHVAMGSQPGSLYEVETPMMQVPLRGAPRERQFHHNARGMPNTHAGRAGNRTSPSLR